MSHYKQPWSDAEFRFAYDLMVREGLRYGEIADRLRARFGREFTQHSVRMKIGHARPEGIRAPARRGLSPLQRAYTDGAASEARPPLDRELPPPPASDLFDEEEPDTSPFSLAPAAPAVEPYDPVQAREKRDETAKLRATV